MSDEKVAQPSVSFARVLTIVIPVALIAAGAYVWSRNLEPSARKELADASFTRILSSNSITPAAAGKFEDKDGDLIADSPEDPKQCINPDVIQFSFVASETESVPEDSWKELFAALKKKSGHDVKYVHFNTAEE